MFARMVEMGIYVLMMFMAVLYVCNAFTPIDNYLIDCGSLSNTTVGQRTFMADTSLSWTLTTSTNSMANTSSNSVSSLYQKARIFTNPSSYSFPIKQQGRHFIRLYFFAFSSQSFKLSTANFSVSTQDSVLLHSFPANSASTPLFKEYSVNITHSTLILSFVPTANKSLAFINAIEVVSVPDNLISDTAQTVNPLGNYQGLSVEPLETVFRINNGGPLVTPANDTLWRTWQPDQSFLLDKNFSKPVSYSGNINYAASSGVTREIAPDVVYSTATELVSTISTTQNARFNVTWQFDVDAGSSYLIRMHFCDIVSTTLNELYFSVYISSYSAVSNLDLSAASANVLATPYYMDFVVKMDDGLSKLNISIGPSSLDNVLPDGILNGLEIMKMNSSGTAHVVSPQGSKANVGVIVGAVLGAVAALAIAVCIVFTLLKRRRRSRMGRKPNTKAWLPFSINGTISQSLGSRFSNGTTATLGQNVSLGYQFSFAVLQEATNNFDEAWVIGVGGFGKVYKGVLRDETRVAVKRGNPKSQQGLNEFRTEIELLSRLRHRHLVSLIGYCDERNEMILVYEYMEKGTLKNHLYGSDLPNLSWKQRLEICIGSARGLHYLHTGQAKAIIHRDVKSANILLDENLMAKVADFGLSKTGPELDQTHVSTAVKGSFGYLDPEYFRRQQLTEKSDVYSFGVVLLEVLCARPVIDPTLPREMVNLAEWAMKFQRRGELDQIIDPRIAGTIRPGSLRKFGETVEKCLADCGVDRPGMGDVLWNLEYVLQLQDAESGFTDVDSITRIDELPTQVQNINTTESVTVGVLDQSANDLSDVSMSRVFSQLVKSEGR
ncbi:receptor-like protein kinase HERK 1 [Dioscorea cayenensis subsp. rotundata]|uniref:Receptor-like protein kinase HERK 1 n=1 Tax=Dioscorea cayennensis subsp. rotundata TaxID=55577 RepID=A0AB40C8X3_DIOCR|nr:receptor-like protein kinase HERK 1 [Dioscorea cayenensis subsp. rotundata]